MAVILPLPDLVLHKILDTNSVSFPYHPANMPDRYLRPDQSGGESETQIGKNMMCRCPHWSREPPVERNLSALVEELYIAVRKLEDWLESSFARTRD